MKKHSLKPLTDKLRAKWETTRWHGHVQDLKEDLRDRKNGLRAWWQR